MKNSLSLTFFATYLMGLCGASLAEDSSEIRFKQISVSGQFDNGQIIEGRVNQNDKNEPGVELNGNFFQRTGVWITQEAFVKERLHLTMGVGGVFWYALPGNDPAKRQTQFGPGISQAQAVYSFGNLKNPVASLQMGYFPYKYNPDAKNLGEYLLRSGTYPGYLWTGGWNMISSAGYMVQGLRLNVPLWGGKFQSDFLLPMEHDIPPLYGISPTYIASLKPIAGIELSAGAACNHCISVKPSLESPHLPGNQIITGVASTYDSGSASYTYTYTRDSTSFYTFQGVKLMGRLSLDPKAFVPMKMLGPEDLKLYSEVALLGVKNYDYLYEKPSERMPVMVGLNLPAFKFLDVLSFELEYYNSKFPNNMRNLIYELTPTWYTLESATQEEVDGYAADVRQDNFKWSVYASKEVTKGIQIYAQVASDHIRTFMINGGPAPALVPITNRSGKEWYYLVRLQFGI